MTRRPGHAPAARRMPWRLSRGRDRPRLFRRLPPSRDRASSERVTSGHGGEDAPRDHGEGREQYASAAVPGRDGRRTHDDHACLGRVVDRERGVFCSRERGYFAFDVATGERGRVPDGFEPDAPEDGRRSRPRTLSFGDAWVPGRLARRSGLWDVVDEVPWANRDTLHAMVAFYMCSRLANCHAEEWWRTSVASLLWPGARLDSQGVSEFLEKVGSRESTLAFQESYARFVLGGLGDDTNVTVDSTGLPNGSGTCPARADVHEGKAGVEARLAVVAQRSTATRPWWELLPGSASDAMSLGRIIARCEGIGVHAGPCPTGAGHRADANLDEPCDVGRRCPAPYVTRPRPNPPGTGRPSRGRRGASSRGRTSPGTETATCSRGGSPSWSARATTSPRGSTSG